MRKKLPRRIISKTLLALPAMFWIGPTLAQDYRFCLAENLNGPEVILSTPFPSDAPMAVVESAFRRVLTKGTLVDFVVQCPRASDREASEAAHKHALRYLDATGRKPIALDWKP